MKKRNSYSWLAFPILVVLLTSLACQAGSPAATAVPTAVPVTPTLTATLLPPTSTPRPTSTPNLAATKQADARLQLLQKYVDAGYLSSTSGAFEDLDDFHQDWAQLGWYQWWPIDGQSAEYGDLVFHGHFAWETAANTSDLSGCGVAFGIQSNENHYAAFIDRSRILFQMARGGKSYMVGKTRGSGRLNLTEPAEADVDIILRGATAYILVDGVMTQYTLSADQATTGQFAYSILSGTNKDFGTRCNITGAYLWTADQ